MKKIFLLLVFLGITGALSVEAAPQKPGGLTPCGNTSVTSLTPRLSWNAVEGDKGGCFLFICRPPSKIGYKWEVNAKNGDFVDGRLLGAQEDNWAIIKPDALRPDNDYTWHVKSTDITGTSGESGWSNLCTFNTNGLQAPPPPSGEKPILYGTNPIKGPLASPVTISGTNFACTRYPNKKNIIIFTGDNNQVVKDEAPKCESLSDLKSAVPNFPETVKTINIQVQVGSEVSNQIAFSIGATPTDSTGRETDAEGLNVAWPATPGWGTKMPTNNLPQLIQYFYEWGISLAGFAAFIVLVIAGFQYLTSAGNPGKMQESMDRIKSAGLGIILLFGSVLVLNTINPQLTQLKIGVTPTNKEIGEITAIDNSQSCQGAIVYSNIDYNKNGLGKNLAVFTASEDREVFVGGASTVGSVKLIGDFCQLKLCQDNNCSDGADPPVVSIFSSTQNIANLGGNLESTEFTSAELINLYKTLIKK